MNGIINCFLKMFSVYKINICSLIQNIKHHAEKTKTIPNCTTQINILLHLWCVPSRLFPLGKTLHGVYHGVSTQTMSRSATCNPHTSVLGLLGGSISVLGTHRRRMSSLISPPTVFPDLQLVLLQGLLLP